MKRLARTLLPTSLYAAAARMKRQYWDRYGRTSFSQEGEDLILMALLQRLRVQPPYYYIDIGAHHAHALSNTYYFYRLGAQGLCVDARPGFADAFARRRPRDIAVECGVALSSSTMTYYAYRVAAYNTFSKALVDLRCEEGLASPTNTVDVPVKPLADILDAHLGAEHVITFMNVDAEGFDLDILRSNNWQRFRPKVIMAEVDVLSVKDSRTHSVAHFLESKDYVLSAKTPRTGFFVDYELFDK